ncbi:MAG TPA: SRPBCC family protein [Anaerolineales bacterium]|nr:SRPBCC family protein [Anaerolineales bacterium]
MRAKTLLKSIGLGAGLMYFLDPQYGNRRRALVRDKANSVVHSMDNFLNGATEDMRNRTRGVLAEMSARFSDQGAPDWILEERVRSNLGRLASRGVDIQADGGRIILRGPVLRENIDSISKAASRTRGVHGVENQLQVFDNIADMPNTQGLASSRKGAEPEWKQGYWSPAMRLLTGVGGSLMTLYGLRRKGLAKPLLSTAGLALATRGVTNLDPRSLLGMGLGENAIKVQKAININVPVDEVYQFWRNSENFPRFMNHVKQVVQQNNLSNWKVAGPAGSTLEFQSHITRDVPNEIISWETLPDSQVHHAGFVRFDRNWDDSTRVSVQMNYVPPAGALGHVVAQLFGVDPKQAMHEDLVRLKSLLEEGRTSTEGEEVQYGERVSY